MTSDVTMRRMPAGREKAVGRVRSEEDETGDEDAEDVEDAERRG